MVRVSPWTPREGGGEHNSRVNLALRAGLILSNPETVRADAHSRGSCVRGAAEMLRCGWVTKI